MALPCLHHIFFYKRICDVSRAMPLLDILLQKNSGDGDTESLQSQSFCASCNYSVSIMSL
jgi:hypothetical protein